MCRTCQLLFQRNNDIKSSAYTAPIIRKKIKIKKLLFVLTMTWFDEAEKMFTVRRARKWRRVFVRSIHQLIYCSPDHETTITECTFGYYTVRSRRRRMYKNHVSCPHRERVRAWREKISHETASPVACGDPSATRRLCRSRLRVDRRRDRSPGEILHPLFCLYRKKGLRRRRGFWRLSPMTRESWFQRNCKMRKTRGLARPKPTEIRSQMSIFAYVSSSTRFIERLKMLWFR